jgi:hypothetical protein
MRHSFTVLGAAAVALALTHAAHAEVGVSGEFGSTGIGTHATIPLSPNLNLRLGANYLHYMHSGSTADLNYDFKLKTNTYDALLDWHPMKDSAFRLTGGLAYNGNRINVHARSNASGTYTIQGHTYNAVDAGTVDGEVSFRKTAPYLGIGWGNAAKQTGWNFSADLGVLMQGSPTTTLTNRGCTAPGSVCTQFAADVARERQALHDEVNRFRFYPVLRIGFSRAF